MGEGRVKVAGEGQSRGMALKVLHVQAVKTCFFPAKVHAEGEAAEKSDDTNLQRSVKGIFFKKCDSFRGSTGHEHVVKGTELKSVSLLRV